MSEKDKGIRRVLRWMGVHLHFSRKFYWVLGAAAVGMVAVFVGMLYYSSSPSFCINCHIMQP
jgi:nitrate/TMAO reductase-like tetraheme cytochrome c subunit